MLCAKVEWNSVNRDRSVLVFTADPDNATTEAVARLPIKTMLDVEQRSAKLPHIILGAASGTFVNDGMRIRVDGFKTRQAHISHVSCSLVDAEGEVITLTLETSRSRSGRDCGEIHGHGRGQEG